MKIDYFNNKSNASVLDNRKKLLLAHSLLTTFVHCSNVNNGKLFLFHVPDTPQPVVKKEIHISLLKNQILTSLTNANSTSNHFTTDLKHIIWARIL